MASALAFDVYGTLVDTDAVKQKLEKYIEGQADSFIRSWRQKQLEYSFRRGLMKDHVDFSLCTKQALDYCCIEHDVYISGRDKKEILKTYRTLPIFNDVKPALKALKSTKFKLFAFSNGSPEAIKDLLNYSDILPYFDKVVSASDVKSFKPDPAVYQHVVETAKVDKENCWMISANSFDIIGAINFGMKSVWVNRKDTSIFDPWDYTPDAIVHKLSDIEDVLKA